MHPVRPEPNFCRCWRDFRVWSHDGARNAGFLAVVETASPASDGATGCRDARWKEGGTDERHNGIVAYSAPVEPGGLAATIKRSTFPSVSLKSREESCSALSKGKSSSRTVSSARVRSEEHTSELQSLAYLVCRL